MNKALQYTDLLKIYKRKFFKKNNAFIDVLEEVTDLLHNEPLRDKANTELSYSGGIVQLKDEIETIIIPDIHARQEVLLNILQFTLEDGLTVFEALHNDKVQIVCVGDAFHSEGRGVQRWHKAYKEFLHDYKVSKNMNAEMLENLNTLEMILRLKLEFPENFHFLKGNHENICNEDREGNYPFGKFVYEGEMVHAWMKKFMGNTILDYIYEIEKSFPLIAVGNGFLISHAEPHHFYKIADIINYRDNENVIYGLTWTADNEADPDSVQKFLTHYFPTREKSFYFAGHRPVQNLYNIRANGRFIQLHNPDKIILAKIKSSEQFNTDHDIIELEDNTLRILEEF